jgi:hypothetical protein
MVLTIFPLPAEDGSGGGRQGEARDIDFSTNISLTVSSRPEAKLAITEHITIPMFRGRGPFFSGNNLRLSPYFDITPVSTNAGLDAVLTPIAFLQAAAGGRVGSGWNIKLFEADIYGIGINRPGPGGGAETRGSAFDGALWSAYAGAALQFDLAALLPMKPQSGVKDWRHVVFRTYHEGRYKGYSAVGKWDSWYFESDDGENRNGFIYYGSYLLGYQMPIILNTVGIMAEMERNLFYVPGGGAWGDDLNRWIFSALLNFTVTERLSAALIAQFRTRRNFEEGRQDDIPDVFYQERHIKSGDPRYLTFYRVAVILSFTLP